jgi:hypothetical protein
MVVRFMQTEGVSENKIHQSVMSVCDQNVSS